MTTRLLLLLRRRLLDSSPLTRLHPQPPTPTKLRCRQLRRTQRLRLRRIRRLPGRRRRSAGRRPRTRCPQTMAKRRSGLGPKRHRERHIHQTPCFRRSRGPSTTHSRFGSRPRRTFDRIRGRCHPSRISIALVQGCMCWNDGGSATSQPSPDCRSKPIPVRRHRCSVARSSLKASSPTTSRGTSGTAKRCVRPASHLTSDSPFLATTCSWCTARHRECAPSSKRSSFCVGRTPVPRDVVLS